MYFFSRVYQICKKIPKGKVATYGQIAKLAGNPTAARAVGRAMKYNQDMERIPCHQVVGSDGSLCGYSAGLGIITKKKLLGKEGVKFTNDKVDLTSSQWQP